MCGPTAAEKSLQAQEQSFSTLLQSDYSQQFQNQQGVLAKLNESLTPTLEAGPNQMGYSPQELAALNTQAINTTGANYRNAAVAAGSALAGRGGGGSSGLESGVEQQIRAGIASGAAGTLSGEQLGITESNYATGRQNYDTALGGAQALAGEYNPLGYAGAGTSANTGAFGEAQTIQQQQAQKDQMIAGLITSGASDALGGLAGGFGNLDTQGTSTGGEQLGNFGSGFLAGFGS
jgi:hypothetical protein